MEQQKKFLLVIVLVGFFLIIVIGAGLFIFAPRAGMNPVLTTTAAVQPTKVAVGASVPSAALGVDNAAPRSATGTAAQATPAVGATTTGAIITGATATGATVAGTAAGNASGSPAVNGPPTVDATDWVRNPAVVAELRPQTGNTTTRGDVIIIYGERPAESVKTGDQKVDTVSEHSTVINVLPPAAANSKPKATSTDPAPIASTPASTMPASAVPAPTAPAAVPALAPTVPKAAAEAKPAAVKPPATPAAAAKPTAATVKPAPAVAQPSVKTPVLVDEYWIQTGAFAVRSRAESVKTTLAEKGIIALIETRDVSGKTLFRVRIGPYTSRSEADYWLTLVKNIGGFSESYISLIKVKR